MKTSLGTLAAVAAMAVASTTASADVQYATHLIGDIVNSDPFYIDINNDGIADYSIINGSQFRGQYQPALSQYNAVAVVSPSNYQAYNFAFGDTVGSASDYNIYGNISMGTSLILGLGFYINEDLHYGWLEFGLDSGDWVILGGAWESTANTPLDITAVPEPATVATGIALLAGAAVLLRRRSRGNAA